MPAAQAAFANAIASHSIELDDVDHLALYHFSPPVMSAGLAVAEQVGATGEELAVALVAGCDTMARASNALNFSLRNRGYHSTPVCGVFGAAVAAGKLMKLDAAQMVSALGLAGAQASGLMEMYGPSMQKRFNPGPAARNGVTAAEMARLGFTGTATIFEGDHGMARAFTDENNLTALTEGLGSVFPLFFEYKPYSCARPIHNAIDCALAVRKELTEPLSAIRSITMRRHPTWTNYHQNARPKTYHEAQVSLPYSFAIALREGGALPPQYRNETLGDPEILRISTMIKIEPDDSLPRGVSCLAIVETEGGKTYRAQVDYPRGSIENPMSKADMDGKAHMLGDPVIGADNVTALIDAVGRMEALPQASALAALFGKRP